MAGLPDTVELDGWRFMFPDESLSLCMRGELMDRVLEAAGGRLGPPIRRSRRASSWCARLHEGLGSTEEFFVKVIDPRRGIRALRERLLGPEARRVARITADLNRAGFAAPPIILIGEELGGGRTLLVTPRVTGVALPRAIRSLGADQVRRKWTMMRELGREIARLHRAGFVHGDLTAYNVCVAAAEPPRFWLLDHERTYRQRVRLSRPRLRNLVQLLRLGLPGFGMTARMRIVEAYAEAVDPGSRLRVARRVARMLRARVDRALAARAAEERAAAAPPHSGGRAATRARLS